MSFQEDLGEMVSEKDSDLNSSYRHIEATTAHCALHSENDTKTGKTDIPQLGTSREATLRGVKGARRNGIKPPA